MDFNSYTNPAKGTRNICKGCLTIYSRQRIVSYQWAFAFFVYNWKEHYCSGGQKEKLDLKQISKQSYKSERTDAF